MWMSNAPWAGTGYGTQTKLLLSALLQRGHDPSCFAFYGLSGGMVSYDGYDVYPNSDFNEWGNDVIKIHTETARASAIITLMDLFVLDQKVWSELGVPWLAWTPIDSEGMGRTTIRMLEIADLPVAMSEFGATQMRNAGVDPAAVIYHGVDTEVFKPLDKAESREYLGLDEDVYVIGMVMANKGDRKQLPLQFEAVKQWMDTHKDMKIQLYIHTEPTAKMGGWDIRELAAASGLEGRVVSTNQYLTSVVPMPVDNMAKLYSSFDVLMNCSSGEGFGIPIVEAQACGTPVLTGNYTAMPEITHNGYTVGHSGKVYAGHYGWQFIPSVEDMVYRLECVYRMDNRTNALMGRQWVHDNCGLEAVTDEWDNLLFKLEQHLGERADAARVAYP